MQLNAFSTGDQLHQQRQSTQRDTPLQLSPVANKPVLLDFNGGHLSSDAGVLLLKEVDQQSGLITALAEAINDPRDERYTVHSHEDLARQRTFQIDAGYEDQNDANTLRYDPIFKMALGRAPLTGETLASQPTLSRFENTPTRSALYRMAQVLADHFIASYSEEPKMIVLDFDDTENRVHGDQQLALFNGYYGDYCFLPLHVYEGLSGRFITAILKPKVMTGKQALSVVRRLIARLRAAWPKTLILFRGDSHFTYPEVMDYIDNQSMVHYVTGIRSNEVLKKMAADVVEQARRLYRHRKAGAEDVSLLKVTRFHSDRYQARTWVRSRRVVIKVEVSAKGVNVRFVVTDLEDVGAQMLYRKIYCARGKAELFIKDHKTYLKSDRTSCHRFEANQFRLFLHSAAYVLYDTLRREILGNTALSKATIESLRLKLIKVGARVEELKTRIKVILPSSCPMEPILRQSFEMLALLRPT